MWICIGKDDERKLFTPKIPPTLTAGNASHKTVGRAGVFSPQQLGLGCPIFAYIFFSLRSETKRNRNRFASFLLRFAKQKQ